MLKSNINVDINEMINVVGKKKKIYFAFFVNYWESFTC